MSMDRSAIETRRTFFLAQPGALILYAFASTLFVSAMLLFSVQPMFAKMVLPKLGGSPSVWAVAMTFFQAMLLIGYCYAHLLTRFAAARWAVVIHLTVCAGAFIFLPLALPAGWEQAPADYAQLWLLGLLAVSVGWPFLAVSATAPLLQAWFSRTGHRDADDPYFLYGASNIGSMAALLGYPVIIETSLGLSSQSTVWAAGFVLLVMLVMLCGWLMLNGTDRAPAPVTTQADAPAPSAIAAAAPASTARPAWRDRLIWVALAFVPSGLLVAFTTHVTTDIASAPFLWIGPLALYLLTYILVFRDKPLVPMPLLLKLQPLAIAGALASLFSGSVPFWLMGIFCGVLAFFATAMICHRTMYERRPDASHLTEFYLWMSLGGVLGGIFTALLAPVIFNIVMEYPLLLMSALLCRRDVLQHRLFAPLRAHAGAAMATAAIAFAFVMTAGAVNTETAGSNDLIAVILALLVAICIASLLSRKLPAAMVMGLLALVLFQQRDAFTSHAERSFFGVHRVGLAADGTFRVLSHGTTLHGGQRIAQPDGSPLTGDRPVPAAYYHPQGPMATVLKHTREHMAAGKALHGGVVGLGAGAFACNTLSGENWRFFEIDPVVVKIARDPAMFTYMSSCQPDAPIVIGDARLTVASEPAGSFDFLLVDAFSSDSIPVHLLTREAVAMYLSRLAPEGVLVMHVSNRYLDLAPVLEAAIAAMPGVHGVFIEDTNKYNSLDAAASKVVAISRSSQALDGIGEFARIERFGDSTLEPWTDDYSNIAGALFRRLLARNPQP